LDKKSSKDFSKKFQKFGPRFSLSWKMSMMSVESPMYCWHSAAHFGLQRLRSKCSFSCLLLTSSESLLWSYGI